MNLFAPLDIKLEEFAFEEVKKAILDKIKPEVRGGFPPQNGVKQFRLYLRGETELSKETVDSINDTLLKHNLPQMHNILAFVRRTEKNSFQTLHIDENDSQIFNSSIIFPVEGCDNSYMYWAIGNYSTELTTHPSNNTKYSLLKWHSAITVLDEIEITSPTAVRVDIPHDAYTNNEWPRVVFSIRLVENLTVDEIMERFKP